MGINRWWLFDRRTVIIIVPGVFFIPFYSVFSVKKKKKKVYQDDGKWVEG